MIVKPGPTQPEFNQVGYEQHCVIAVFGTTDYIVKPGKQSWIAENR